MATTVTRTHGFVALAVAFAASAALAATTPSPPTAHFNDWAAFVTPARARRLDARLAAYQAAAGHHVIVAIFPSLPDPDMQGFTVRTAHAWGVGRKGHDDGVVLFVFAADRKMRIEVGYGLEGEIPDVIAKRILDDVITPRLRAGDKDGALEAGVEALIAAAGGAPFATAPPLRAPVVVPPPNVITVTGADIGGVLAVIAAIAVASVLAHVQARPLGGSIPGVWFAGIVILTLVFFGWMFFWFAAASRLALLVAGSGLVWLGQGKAPPPPPRYANRRRGEAPADATLPWWRRWQTTVGALALGTAVVPWVDIGGWTPLSVTILAGLAGPLFLWAAGSRYWWFRIGFSAMGVALILTFVDPRSFLVLIPGVFVTWVLLGMPLDRFFRWRRIGKGDWFLPAISAGSGTYSSGGYSRSSGSSSGSSSSSSSGYSGGGGRFGGGGASGGW